MVKNSIFIDISESSLDKIKTMLILLIALCLCNSIKNFENVVLIFLLYTMNQIKLTARVDVDQYVIYSHIL